VFVAELCCPQRIRFSLPNLCGAQRIRCSLPKYVVRSESGVRCRIVLSVAYQAFAAKLCCPHRFRFLLPNLCGPQQIKCSQLNCVVRSEFGVRCRIVLSAVN